MVWVTPALVRELVDRRRGAEQARAAVPAGVVRALAVRPAEVGAARASGRDEVDLLPRVLPDLADPQIAGEPVEREAPGIAEAVRPDLAAPARLSDERIVGRNRVSARAAHVEAQDLALELREVLRVRRVPVVALREIEHAVGTEGEHARVVELVGARDLEQDRGRRGSATSGFDALAW